MTKKPMFNTVDVIAVAVAVYEHNNKTIVRSPVKINEVDYLPNRQLITDQLNNASVPFTVTNDHRDRANAIIAYLQHSVLMQTIKGAPDKFLGQITELLANKEVTSKDFGILAWAPHLADQYEKKDGIREVSARYELQSRHIGNIGDKLVVNFSIIDKRYVQRMDCYAVYGVTEEGNLVFYWAKTLDKVCESGTIAGRVKAHNKDQYRNNAKVTILNYIKVL